MVRTWAHGNVCHFLMHVKCRLQMCTAKPHMAQTISWRAYKNELWPATNGCLLRVYAISSCERHQSHRRANAQKPIKTKTQKRNHDLQLCRDRGFESRRWDFPSFFFHSRTQIFIYYRGRVSMANVPYLFAAHSIAFDPWTEIQDNCIVSPYFAGSFKCKLSCCDRWRRPRRPKRPIDFAFLLAIYFSRKNSSSFIELGYLSSLLCRDLTQWRAAYFVIMRYSLLRVFFCFCSFVTFRCCCCLSSPSPFCCLHPTNERTNEWIR